MPRYLNYLFLSLVVLAVGTAQIVGAQASYFCECSGQNTVLQSCEPSCHEEFHHRCCSSEHAAPASRDGDTLPPDHEHEHEKVLHEVVGTPTPQVLQIPAVFWVAIVTDPFPAMAADELVKPWLVSFDIEPPTQEPLPKGVLISRTTVMLV